VSVCVCERERACVCERESVCICVREGVCVCACVCVRERVRDVEMVMKTPAPPVFTVFVCDPQQYLCLCILVFTVFCIVCTSVRTTATA